MRKILLILLFIGISFLLISCKDKNENNTEVPSEGNTGTESSPEKPTDAFRLSSVSDVSGDDKTAQYTVDRKSVV